MAMVEVATTGNNSTYTQLPLLKPRTKYGAMPKRYEETKPVVTQNCSHSRILELGSKLHRATFERYEHDKILAMHAVENAVWKKAEVIKQELISKALKKATGLHEREIKKLVKAHERTLKDEIMKLEQEMERVAREELKKQREASEKHLQEVVESLEKLRLAEKLEAVAVARSEEIEKAQIKLDKVVREFTQKYENVREECEAIKDVALKDLEEKLLQEREEAIQKARVEEQALAEDKLEHQKGVYEQNIRVMHTKISEHKSEISRLHNEILSLMRQRERVMDELLDTRLSYQTFIDDVKPFEPKKSEYVMPPLRSITII